jgi:hypothetical protein
MAKERGESRNLFDLYDSKSSVRVAMNSRLISVSFIIFIFIITTKPAIFLSHALIAAQLILSIPFLLTSTLNRSKLDYFVHSKAWDTFGWITFVTGYTFLLNVVGIIIANYVSLKLGIIFFVVNWVLALTYSAIEVSINRKVLKRRLFKDLFFITLQVVLGLLPALGVF